MYSTGFESSDGFKADTNYKGDKNIGNNEKQWHVYYGCVSTNSKIEGEQSLQMRYYSGDKKTPYAEMSFSVNKVTDVSFSAKAGAKGKIKVQYSIDEGKNWNDGQQFDVSSNVSEIKYTISEKTLSNVRIKITSLLTISSKNVSLCIDEFKLINKDTRKNTTTTFGSDIDNQTFTINEGEESSFPTHVATCTTDGVTGTFAYTSDNACVTVDQNGKTAPGTGFGKAKITATFTPDETYKDTYAESSAFYYIDYKEKEKAATTLLFENSSVALTTLDYSSFTGQKPTLKSGDTELTYKSIAYSKDDTNNVISTLNEDGTLVLSGNAGTAKVTATFGGNSEYASSTASYTINVRKVYASLADLKKDITSTETEYSLRLKDAVVSYVNATTDQTNVYIEDASAGVLVFFAKQLVSDFKAGDKLNGEVTVMAKTYYNLPEITSWIPTDTYKSVEGSEIPLTTVTISELLENYDKYECRRVKVENATVTTATTGARQSGQISQSGSSITLRTNADITTKKDDVIDVIGYPGIYNTGKQFNVWSQDDITVKSSVVATTLSLNPATTEYTVEKGKETAFTAPAVIVTDANNETVADAKITYKSSNTNVATVDSETGNVTFGSEFGTTTITASYAGDATHKAATDISYNIIYGKVKTTMAWSETEVKANIGQDFTAPTLSLTADGESILEGKTITYESTDENVAAFVDGTLVIGDEGTTTITAKFAGDDTYAEASASYTLTVVDPNKMEVTFDFTDPSKYNYTNPIVGNGTTLEEGATISSGIVTITNVKSGGTSTSTPNVFWNKKGDGITLRFYQNAKATISVPDGYLIKSVQFSNSKEASDIVITPEQYDSETSTWTGSANIISLSFNGAAWLTSMTVSYAKSPEATSGTLDFKAVDDDIYYATFSSDKDVIFNKKDVYVAGVSVSNGKISLNDLTENIYVVTDATAGEDKDGAVEGYYVPANTGILVYGFVKSTTYYFPTTATTPTLPANQLKPAPANGGILTAEDGYKYYKLAYDDFEAKTGLGFYWGADNAGAFSVKAGTAYLAVPISDANNAKGFTFDGGTTGINEITTNDSKVKNIYNLNGQRVENMSHAGLYIVNGKKVVIRK